MSAYLTETLTYGELVERMNDIGRRLLEKEDAQRALSELPPPAPEYATWQLTIRKDPHDKLLGAIYRVQDMRPTDALGLRALRDVGDREASILFAGYYSAVSKCVQMDGHKTAAEWQRALEDDSPESYELDDMIGRLATYYFLQLKDAEGKSAAPSTGATTGENEG